jgi:hypothetical protein
MIANGASEVDTGTHEICMQDEQHFDDCHVSLTLRNHLTDKIYGNRQKKKNTDFWFVMPCRMIFANVSKKCVASVIYHEDGGSTFPPNRR